MQTDAGVTPDQDEVRRRLRAAHTRLTDAAATLLALGSFTDADATSVRHALKTGRSTRSTVSQMRHGIKTCERLAEQLRGRAVACMADGPVGPLDHESGVLPEADDQRERSRRRRSPREARPLRDIPPAGSVRPLEARQREVVEPPSHAAALDRVLAGDEERLIEAGQRTQLIRLVESGNSIRVALRKIGMEPTASRRRWAQRVMRQWRSGGQVLDGRWIRQTERKVLTPLVESIILRIWNGRRGASAAAVHREVEKAINVLHAEAAERGVPCDVSVPAYETVQKYLARLPEAMRLVRASGLAGWDKQARMVVTYDSAEYGNHRWQIDHTRLDIWVRVETAPGVWEPAEVWLTAIIDVYSRAIMGWWLAARPPNAWTTALVMRHAIVQKDDPDLPLCGLPVILTPDHGADFMSHRVALLVQGLGVLLEPTPPHYPNMKGQIERWFGTLNAYLTQLVGAMENDGRSLGAARLRLPYLLTLPQLRAEIKGFVADYHQRVHSVTGETPIRRWQRTVRLSLLGEEEVNILMLQSDQMRQVTRQGISFHVDGRGGHYLAEELQHYWRCRVRIRYNPEDLDSILVFEADTGVYICEAWLEGVQYTVDDVKRWRRGFREQLKRRTSTYMEEMLRDDRRSARAWDEAEGRAGTLRTSGTRSTAPAPEETSTLEQAPGGGASPDVDKLLRQFRNRDRR